MKTYIYIILCFCSLPIFAQNSSTWVDFLHKSDFFNAVGVLDTLAVKDPVTYTSGDAKSYNVQVALAYNRKQHTDLKGKKWGLKVNFTLTLYGGNTILTTQVKDVVLYANDSFPVYENVFNYIQANPIAYNTTVRAKMKINSLIFYPNGTLSPAQTLASANALNNSLLPSDIHIELRLIADKKPVFIPAASPIIGYRPDTINKIATVYWEYVQQNGAYQPKGATEYEMEYVYLDSFSTERPNTWNKLFKQGTRISTTENYYELPLTFPAGKVFVRVRGIGRFWNTSTTNDYTRRRNGAWSLVDSMTIQAFERDKNWQVQSSFAEDGKRKDVIVYRDGTNRSRQTLTNLSTTKYTLIAETKTNNEGMLAIQFLPIVDTAYSLKYRYNVFTQGDTTYNTYDFEGLATALPIDSTSLGGAYYSSLNPFINLSPNVDRIPHANGYPFSQTSYDNEGRVFKQGGVGADMQIGSGHEQILLVGNPSERELRRLFGSNVGAAKFYTKEMHIDANGQLSIVYKDMKDKIIATALAGLSPSNVEAIPENITELMTVSLDDNNHINEQDFISTSTSQILNVIPQSQYDFSYDLIGIINQGDNTLPVCATCVYDLSIRITAPDNTLLDTLPSPNGSIVLPLGGQLHQDTTTYELVYKNITASPGWTCAEDSFLSGIVNFSASFAKIGRYTITKTLTLSGGAIDSLIARLDTFPGFPDSTVYITTAISQIDSSGCETDCSTGCDAYVANLATMGVYTQLELNDYHSVCLAACTEINDTTIAASECNSILLQIRDDLSPGGWIFSDSTLMDSILLLAQNASIPITDPNGLQILDNDTLEAYWQDTFAILLQVHHREYCHYTQCKTDSLNKIYDLKIAQIPTWTEAQNTGFLNPLTHYPNNIVINFPFPYIHYHVSSGGKDSYSSTDTAFRSKIYHYYKNPQDTTQTLSLWQYVHESTNRYGHNGADLYSDIPNPNQDSVRMDSVRWQKFVGLYLGAKALFRTQANTCPYFSDGYEIVDKPRIGAKDSISDFLLATQNIQDMCAGLAENNVRSWMSTLTQHCSAIIGHPDSLTFANTLRDSLLNDCNLGNPLALITHNAIATGKWSFVNSMLNAMGCTLSIDTIIATAGGYVYGNDSVAVNCQISPCLSQLIQTANNANFASGSATLTNCFLNTQYAWFSPDKIVVGKDSSGDCLCNASLFFMDSLGIQQTISQLNNLSFEAQSPIPTNITWDWGTPPIYTGIKGTATTTNGTKNIWLYALYLSPKGNSCNAIELTRCKKVLMPTGFSFPPSIDSLLTFEYNPDSQRVACIKELRETARQNALILWQEAVDSFASEIIYHYFNKCFQHTEHFSYSYQQQEYHYTLYYYDQAGQLVATVPPDGVDILDASHFNNRGKYIVGSGEPQHRLVSRYEHNSLNQVHTQFTPDGGLSKTWIDSKGRPRISQNAKQATNNKYAYMLYDQNGRQIETAQITLPPNMLPSQGSIDESATYPRTIPNIPNANIEDISKTVYNAVFPISTLSFTTKNVRNRIAYTQYANSYSDLLANKYQATYYKYNARGEVTSLVQRIMSAGSLTPIQKRIDYKFDLISGKVNEVIYQPTSPNEMFIHKYSYDADNRITTVETSKDRILWYREAEYFYLPHGPLARVELGHAKVQGLDYYYTLQGWLKGINMPDAASSISPQDPGADGNNTSNNLNKWNAQDEMAMALGYYEGDYQPIAPTYPLSNASQTAWTGMGAKILSFSPSQKGLYNGNIAYMLSDIAPRLNGTQNALYQGALQGMAYQYDQLNRLKDAFTFRYIGNWDYTKLYNSSYTYDPNGNIKTALQNSPNLVNITKDILTYHYPTDAAGHLLNNNRLLHVNDLSASTAETDDIDDQGVYNLNTPNYAYDEIGNLTQDNAEGISNIEWNTSGKIRKITFTNGKPEIEFQYDALGNRIAKWVKTNPNSVATWTKTYYLRDAQGNVLYTEVQKPNNITDKEYSIYGSSRIGTYTEKGGQTFPSYFNAAPIYRRILDRRIYELSNHLGNVLVTLSDHKYGIAPQGATAADFYVGNIRTATDYYPFGAEMPKRSFSVSGYRFGFNGKEMDNEVSGSGNQYDYGFRIYNPRLGKFLSVDPLTKDYPWNSPYAFAENRVIDGIDLEGLEYAQKTSNINVGTIKIQVQSIDLSKYNYKAPSPQPSANGFYANDNTYQKYTREALQRGNMPINRDIEKKDIAKQRGMADAVGDIGTIFKVSGAIVTPFAPPVGVTLNRVSSVFDVASMYWHLNLDIRENNLDETNKTLLSNALSYATQKVIPIKNELLGCAIDGLSQKIVETNYQTGSQNNPTDNTNIPQQELFPTDNTRLEK